MKFARALAVLCALVSGAPGGAQIQPEPDIFAAQPGQQDDWSQEKCALFALIFKDALDLQGHEGLSPDFLNTNQRFIDSGCAGERTLCPRSEAELAFADLLTLMTMNEGMASTFVPFGCPG